MDDPWSRFPSTVPALVDFAAAEHGDLDALVDDERRVSFAQLAYHVDAAAGALANSGVAAGSSVAIWAPSSIDWAVTALAIYAVGGVVVPINTRFKPAEARQVLERSRAEVVFTGGRFLDLDFLAMLEQAQPLSHVREIISFGPEAAASAVSWTDFAARCDESGLAEVASRKAALQAEDVCDLIFTSGTTGRPKGVMLRHGASIRAYEAWTEAIGLRRGDRFLVVFPYFQTSGLKAGIVACLLRGAANVPQAVFDVPDVLRRIPLHGITVVPGPPTAFRMLLDAAAGGAADLSTLRIAVTGGASTPVALVREMQQQLNLDAVITAYGLTETTGLVSMCRAGDSAELIASSVGRPVPGVEVRAVERDGSDVEIGKTGELVVRGYNVMAGYHDDPEATASAIDADGWFHTGDIGTIDSDGVVRITDRLKDMFIVGGFNVYPAEVEAVLGDHPAIAQVAVVGVPEPRLGEVGAAFVVLAPDHQHTTSEVLHTWSREQMANYKVPRAFYFVEQLPLNASGKVLKYELRLLAEERDQSDPS